MKPTNGARIIVNKPRSRAPKECLQRTSSSVVRHLAEMAVSGYEKIILYVDRSQLRQRAKTEGDGLHLKCYVEDCSSSPELLRAVLSISPDKGS